MDLIFSKKHKIPFCIYTCASFLERKANMWWFGLEDYLLQHSNIFFNNEKIQLNTKNEKNIAFLKIRDYLISKINDYENAKNAMQEMGIDYDADKYNDLRSVPRVLRDSCARCDIPCIIRCSNITHRCPLLKADICVLYGTMYIYCVRNITKAVNLSMTLLIVLNYFNNSKKNINFATE